ncbi:MAG: hypothetical protein QHH07_10845 [Sedimentisphaerales bacterium]|jgi:hypothetical protein|nr:hypothetical protein [Sedimentisphaerales bacterium]
MDQANLLIRAYYEALYDILAANMELLVRRVGRILNLVLGDKDIGPERMQGYLDACLAFVEERLESYNPIGIQYLFDWAHSPQVSAIGQQLDWFDSREELDQLYASAQRLAEPGMTDDQLRETALQLVREHGAFPDRSIINAYHDAPAPNKLPDYVVAMAIESVLKEIEV